MSISLKGNILAALCLGALVTGCGSKVSTADVSAGAKEVTVTSPSVESEDTSEPTEQTSEVVSEPAQEENSGEVQSETTETEEVTEETTAPEEEEQSDDPVEQKLSELSLQDKVCQMFIVTPEQLTGYGCVTYADQAMEQALSTYNVGGIIFFAQNLSYWDQTTGLLADCQTYSMEKNGLGLFTAVDEEGGTVARAAQKLGTTALYNMEYYGSLNDSETAYGVGTTLGRDLASLGFNVDFAPVADVNLNPANELGSRIFSSDPYIVSDMVSNVVMGIQDQGVCATLKHFPGLGSAGGNTHYDNYVHIYRTLDELRAAELIPFRGGIEAGADFVMVGHQIVSGIGDELPADLSYSAVTGLLRNELGFEGLAVTDAQQMNTISGVYGSGGAAVMSVEAGIDLILMPADLPSAVWSVCDAVESGRITEERIDESVRRILRKKYELGLMEE